MKTGFRLLAVLAAIVALSACGEREQALTGGVKSDTPAANGPATAFSASGWKQGDKTSWESQLRARTQAGQNDYNKVN